MIFFPVIADAVITPENSAAATPADTISWPVKNKLDCYYTAATVKGKVGQCRKGNSNTIEKSRSNSRNRDSLRSQFEEDAGVRVLKSLKRNKLTKTINQRVSQKKRAKEQELEQERLEQQRIEQEALQFTTKCSNCALHVTHINSWNSNLCDECVEREAEIFGEDKHYFKLKKLELQKFNNDILPKLAEMASENDYSKFIDTHYNTEVYQADSFEEYKEAYLKAMNTGFIQFYKKVNKLYDSYLEAINRVSAISDIVSVGMDLEDGKPYYYNDDITTWDLNELLSLHCSNNQNLDGCNSESICVWEGKQVSCNPKKKHNACLDKYVPGSKHRKHRVKKGEVYMSESEGACNLSRVGLQRKLKK